MEDRRIEPDPRVIVDQAGWQYSCGISTTGLSQNPTRIQTSSYGSTMAYLMAVRDASFM